MKDQILAAMAEGRLGPAPGPGGVPDPAAAPQPPMPDPAAVAAAVAGAGQQPPAPAQTPPAPPVPPKQTPAEQAAAKVRPADQGEQASVEEVSFIRIGSGDAARELSSKQVESILDRYTKLNHRWQSEHAPMQPILEMVQEIMQSAEKSGVKATPADVAGLFKQAIKAFTHNAVQGGQQGDGKKGNETKPPKPAMGGDDDFERTLAAWEEQNAVSLPPGYKEQLASTRSLEAKLDRVMSLLEKAMTSARMGTQAETAANQAIGQANEATAVAAQQTIQNNLTRALVQAQLPMDEATLKDLFQFAMARGYVPEDFIDSELAATVANDYKANKDAPEIQRMREIFQRRQAFTGSTGASPGAGGGDQAAPTPQAGVFNQMLENVSRQRGLL